MHSLCQECVRKFPGQHCIKDQHCAERFHQGNSQLLGEAAGIQCACNALYALCWTQIKKIFHWVRRDLYQITAVLTGNDPFLIKNTTQNRKRIHNSAKKYNILIK